MPSLVLIENGAASHRFALEKPEVTLGRRADNDIMVPNMMVSGHHCKVVKTGAKFMFHDNNSTNGSFINGVRVTSPVEIHHQDHIKLGNVPMIFLTDDTATVSIDESKLQGQRTDVMDARKITDTGSAAPQLNPEQLTAAFSKLKTAVMSGTSDRTTLTRQFTEVDHLVQLMDGQLRESEKFHQKLNVLYEVSKAINATLAENELLKDILDLALKVMNADCGFIMLYDDRMQLVPKISRKIESNEIGSSTATFSTTISRQVAESGASILTSDAQNDTRFQSGASIISHNIRSVICSPMNNKDQKVIGVIYVGSNVMSNVFSNSDVELLEAFANHAAIAIENARLYEEKRRKEHLKSALERYVSKQIAEHIMSHDETGDIRFTPEKKEVTVIFTDVRGFTPLAEVLSPETMIEILNRYFTEMISIIFKYGGTLDKFIGDSIMAIFGAPATTGDDEYNAIMSSIDMQRAVTIFNEGQRKLGQPELHVGIGINTGPVVVGNIGSDQRMEYTAIGDNVNLASRLQGHAGGGKILIAKATYEKVKTRIKAKPLEAIKVKGKANVVDVYEVEFD